MTYLTTLQLSWKQIEVTCKQAFRTCFAISLVVLTLLSTAILKAEGLSGQDEPREFETLEELLDSLNKKKQIDPNTAVFVHGMSFSVPHEPETYQGNQERQRTLWNRALKLCDPVDPSTALSTECVVALTKYFAKEPVWKYNRLYYYSDPMGLLNTTYNEINRRHYAIPYGYDDYSIGQVPLWGDIFDGRLKQRVALFSRVAQDPQCMELSAVADTGIQTDLAEQCSANEMYKYAAYLDSCTAALQRLHVLKSPTRSRNDKYIGLNRYETSKVVILENIESRAERDIAQKSVEKGLLHVSWVIGQCVEDPLVIEKSPGKGQASLFEIAWSRTTVEDDELMSSIKRTHDVALNIAAKSGDEWAIRSLPQLSKDLVSYVFERYPLLVHRHLGSDTGGFSDELEWEELRRHEAKAYLLLEDLAGPEVAQREFNPINLQAEIDYIRNGGELEFLRH